MHCKWQEIQVQCASGLTSGCQVNACKDPEIQRAGQACFDAKGGQIQKDGIF